MSVRQHGQATRPTKNWATHFNTERTLAAMEHWGLKERLDDLCTYDKDTFASHFGGTNSSDEESNEEPSSPLKAPKKDNKGVGAKDKGKGCQTPPPCAPWDDDESGNEDYQPSLDDEEAEEEAKEQVWEDEPQDNAFKANRSDTSSIWATTSPSREGTPADLQCLFQSASTINSVDGLEHLFSPVPENSQDVEMGAAKVNKSLR